MFGYRPAEFGIVLDHTTLPDASFRVRKIHPNFYDDIRTPVQISLGCHVKTASALFPDLNHGPSQLAGMTKRVAAAMPPIDQPTLRRFRRFVKRFLNSHLQSLTFDPDEDFDFQEWLDNAPYTRARKKELHRIYYAVNLKNKVELLVKAFIKAEFYEDPKHNRGIYSRSDAYKVLVGPYFKKFGDKLFDLPWFIKKIPVHLRPAHLLEKIQDYKKIFCTDFSQFEATFVKDLMLIARMVHCWCLRKHPRRDFYVSLFDKMINTNIIAFKKFTCQVDCKRMSGEMNTSCDNGLMNFLMTMFVLVEAGNKLEDIMALFEGDDGVTECMNLPTSQQYRDLGAIIKIEVPESISTASFCGQIFDPIALHNVTNPMEASVRFGWVDPKYAFANDTTRMKLLRAKSLSMLYSYPGCPILRNLALYGLRMTDKRKYHVDTNFIINNFTDSYKINEQIKIIEYMNIKANLQEMLNIRIHPNTRQLVSKMYGISEECQLYNEGYLDSLDKLTPLDLVLPFPHKWQVFMQEYCVNVERMNKHLNFVKTGYVTPYYIDANTIRYAYH